MKPKMINNHAQAITFGAKVAPKAWSTPWTILGLKLITAALLIVGSWQVGSSAYLLAKAHYAQYLIANAWQATREDGQPHKPWDWADTFPVAKLSFPSLAETSYVLEGASGRNMAFGPARSMSSGMPGDSVATVISAHNDSHFNFLGKVQLNDLIEIETIAGHFTYQVSDLRIIDSSRQQVTIKRQDELILTTCYPFNALQTGGTMRYQLTARRVKSGSDKP